MADDDPQHPIGTTLPPSPAGSGKRGPLAEPARNTSRAYTADWAHFARWCRMQGTAPLPPAPAMIGRYIADLAAPKGAAPALAVSTIQRRLSGLVWHYAQRGFVLDRQDCRIVSALAAIRRSHSRPPVRKEPIQPDQIAAMVATLPRDLRGLRDRAILLLGHAAGLRRSEIVGLDCHRDDTGDGSGWIEILPDRALVWRNVKSGWRSVGIARGTSARTCPVQAVADWLHFARIVTGPVFLRISRDGTRPLDARLSDKHVARLIKRTVLDAGLRRDLPEAERLALFSGQSLRASRNGRS